MDTLDIMVYVWIVHHHVPLAVIIFVNLVKRDTILILVTVIFALLDAVYVLTHHLVVIVARDMNILPLT